MKELLVRTKPKDSFTLLYQTAVLTSKLHSILHYTWEPIVTMNWQLGIWKRTIHSQIFEKVITTRSNVDDGKTWTTLHVPTGCYELNAMNAEIICIHGNSDIAIFPHVNTLQCILTVVGSKCKVSFDVPNYLASVLGFT